MSVSECSYAMGRSVGFRPPPKSFLGGGMSPFAHGVSRSPCSERRKLCQSRWRMTSDRDEARAALMEAIIDDAKGGATPEETQT